MRWVLGLLFISTVIYGGSIERGKVYYFQYCASCHSLRYTKANFLSQHAQNIEPWVAQSVDGHWISPLNEEDAEHWFGRMPPDLSLITQQFSKQFVVHYLLGFYDDPSHPLGRNNHILPNVLMPDVLSSPCQTHLCLSKPLKNANISQAQIADDIAEFLAYIAEPQWTQRWLMGLGIMVLSLGGIVLAWFLKKRY
jgi:ubiquinol-cytochrome c reductase cytochrome c1 subunit